MVNNYTFATHHHPLDQQEKFQILILNTHQNSIYIWYELCLLHIEIKEVL